MKSIKLSVLLLALALGTSCGPRENEGSSAGGEQLKGEVKIDGSSTVFPITEAIAEEFKADQRDVKVTIGVSGTGGGFKKFGRGEIDINNASKKINEEQKKVCESNKISFVELSVAYDGLAVIVHPENTWAKDITSAELKKIWEPEAQGKITRWNQIRPEWPNQEINLFGPGVESGTYDYFTEAIVGKAHSSRGDFTASENDNTLVQGVSGDKLALGFFGLAYYEENKDKLKLVSVNGVMPSIETVKNKTYAPLSRPLYIYVNSNAAKRPEVQGFVNFYLDQASAITKDVGYISLNDDEYKAEKTKFENFVKGLK